MKPYYYFSLIVAVTIAIPMISLSSVIKKELYVNQEPPEKAQEQPNNDPKTQEKGQKTREKPAENTPKGPTNLPIEYRNRKVIGLLKTNTQVVLPENKKGDLLDGLNPGDDLLIHIQHSILAFPDEQAPVVAFIRSGGFKGSKLLGTSKLEPNSQRIFINFYKIVAHGVVYNLKASALTSEGVTGFSGDYHSRETEFFAGNFISSMIAAYFDGLVPKSTNPFGQVIDDNSVNSAFKKGLASGALSTADRFKDKLKKVPEFSELKGPIHARVLILDVAIENSETQN